MQASSKDHGVSVVDLTREISVSKNSSTIALPKRQYVGWPGPASALQDALTSGSTTPPREGTFRIPSSVFEEAKANNRPWTFKLYKGLSGETVRLHYCTSLQESERIAQSFLGCHVLGFDMEWCTRSYDKDHLKRNISVIQIANEREIAIFHIAVHEGSGVKKVLAPSLQRILESTDIIKCGVCADSVDGVRLERFMRIKPAGLLELSRLENLTSTGTEAPRGKEFRISLANLVSRNLGLWLDKGPVRTSDWTKRLTEKQIEYASSDAYAGYMIFEALDRKRLRMSPPPPLPKTRTPQEAKAIARSYGPRAEKKAVGNQKALNETQNTVEKKNDVSRPVASAVNGNHIFDKDQAFRSKRPQFVNPPDISTWQAPRNRVALGELQQPRQVDQLNNPLVMNSHSGSPSTNFKQQDLYQFLVRLRDNIKQTASGSFAEIVSDRTLNELAERRPSTVQELVRIPGAGLLHKHAKARGTSLLESINDFVDPPGKEASVVSLEGCS